MGQSLMKVQIGPVQEFIAQARSTRDMWAGSYLLSWLTASAMKVFKEAEGCEFVFPTLEDQPLYKMFCGTPSNEGLIPTLPNVFMMLVSDGRETDLAEEAKTALKQELRKIGDACWREMKKQGAADEWKQRWAEQIEAFPVLNWQAIPFDSEENKWAMQVKALGEQLAARRNTRDFAQWAGVEGASKDVLSGKEEIIGDKDFWGKDFWEKAGPFGAMNCIKRLFPKAFLEPRFDDCKSFWENMGMFNTRDLAARNKDGESEAKDDNGEKKPKNPYFAVIAMDGDRMGVALKKITSKKEHTEFSKTLAQFSRQEVKPLVDKAGGQLVYAGGDDVLVMSPADRALELAKALRDKFADTMKHYIDPAAKDKMDASCGIAVGHYQFPLQRIVEEARKAESRAKNKRDRAAFELTLLKRSGEIIQWGAKWESPALKAYQDFTNKSAGEHPVFSGRFAYALAELLQPYRLDDKKSIEMKLIIQKEFEHIQGRQAVEKGAVVEHALEYLQALNEQNLEDFPTLFLASAFMNRERGEN